MSDVHRRLTRLHCAASPRCRSGRVTTHKSLESRPPSAREGEMEGVVQVNGTAKRARMLC